MEIGLTDLFYERVSAGDAHEKRIHIALGEGWKTVGDHEVFCLSA